MKKARVFLLFAALLAAGCGADVGGSWRGSWSTTAGPSGPLNLDLRQNGGEVTGVATLPGNACLPSATVEGRVDGEEVALTLSRGGVAMELAGEVDSEAMAGTFAFEGGGCAGQTGTWTAEK